MKVETEKIKNQLSAFGKVPSIDGTSEHTLHLDRREQFCFSRLRVFHSNVCCQVDSILTNLHRSNEVTVEVPSMKFHREYVTVVEIRNV